jgi:hypothetical protein
MDWNEINHMFWDIFVSFKEKIVIGQIARIERYARRACSLEKYQTAADFAVPQYTALCAVGQHASH